MIRLNETKIDWTRFKEILDSNYRYYDKKGHRPVIILLESIYARYQNGERTDKLLEDLEEMELVFDYGW